MLSGTESNRGTKCIPRLARFNPRLALIGFLGTRACNIINSQPLTGSRQILTTLLKEHSLYVLREGLGNEEKIFPQKHSPNKFQVFC